MSEKKLSGIPIPIEMHLKIVDRFGREYTLEHIVIFLLERESQRFAAEAKVNEDLRRVRDGYRPKGPDDDENT